MRFWLKLSCSAAAETVKVTGIVIDCPAQTLPPPKQEITSDVVSGVDDAARPSAVGSSETVTTPGVVPPSETSSQVAAGVTEVE